MILWKEEKKKANLPKKIKNYSNYLIILSFFILSCSDNETLLEELKLFELYSKYKDTTSRYNLLSNVNMLKNDSLKQRLIFKYAYKYLKNEDSLNFNFWNNQAYILAEKREDSLSIAETFWDRGAYNYKLNRYDSAYYFYQKASKIYLKFGDLRRTGNLILSAAIARRNLRDYLGSEVTTVEAMKIFNQINYKKGLYDCYNNLGVIYNNLELFDLALNAHKNALHKAENINSTMNIVSSYNNIGVVYLNQNNYRQANRYFKKALSFPNLLESNPRVFAMLLDNEAYSRMFLVRAFKNDVLSRLEKSLKLRDSLNHEAGVSINNIHRAEFYLLHNDTVKAIELLKNELDFAKKTNNVRDKLKTLKMLSQTDTVHSTEYLKNYLNISDSLILGERLVRNKFARVQFETDLFKQNNVELSQQRNNILTLSIFTFVILTLIFYSFYLKTRNKKLRLKQEQDIANQEIYNLLIQQQQKIEFGRQQEKNRISKELHDGILGQLHGIRFLLYTLDDMSENTKKKQLKYLNELKILESQIRSLSHELKNTENDKMQSFPTLLKNLLEERSLISKTNFSLGIDQNIDYALLDNSLKINCYRIIQEAVFNVIKYADASECKVLFTIGSKNLMLIIKDNGRGFDVKKNRQGIGLKNMEERVDSLGGKLRITSGINGTRIVILVPQTKIYGKP